MDEIIDAESKGQAPQKPPLSRRRIAGEILAGMATGFAAGLSVAFGYVVLMIPIVSGKGCYAGEAVLAGAILFVFPPAYGLGNAIGVYLVGRIGKQTGSFLLTLGCGFLGGLGAIAILLNMFYVGMVDSPESIIPWSLMFLAPVIMATLCFNLTRRYKEPKEDVDRESRNQEE